MPQRVAVLFFLSIGKLASLYLPVQKGKAAFSPIIFANFLSFLVQASSFYRRAHVMVTAYRLS